MLTSNIMRYGRPDPLVEQIPLRAGPLTMLYEEGEWRAEIIGDSSGAITFRIDGMARTTFLKNRIGFCVLHPATAAGARCVVTHVDGATESGMLPEYIVSAQPVLPFAEMQSLRHEVAPGYGQRPDSAAISSRWRISATGRTPRTRRSAPAEAAIPR